MADPVTRQERTREARLRRMAARQGLRLVKSRRRDPRALDYGRWWLIAGNDIGIFFGDEYGATLDEVEEYLTREPIRDER